MSDRNIAELRELRAQATPGPWRVEYLHGGWQVHRLYPDGNTGAIAEVVWRVRDGGEPDADLIVAAVNALPAILERMEKLEALEKAAEDLECEKGWPLYVKGDVPPNYIPCGKCQICRVLAAQPTREREVEDGNAAIR